MTIPQLQTHVYPGSLAPRLSIYHHHNHRHPNRPSTSIRPKRNRNTLKMMDHPHSRTTIFTRVSNHCTRRPQVLPALLPHTLPAPTHRPLGRSSIILTCGLATKRRSCLTNARSSCTGRTPKRHRTRTCSSSLPSSWWTPQRRCPSRSSRRATSWRSKRRSKSGRISSRRRRRS